MTFLELVTTLKEALNTLFVSRYTLHLERSIEQLRGENIRLQIRLEQTLNPEPQAPQKREVKFPEFKPMKTSWELFVEEDIARQEAEAQKELQEKN